MMLSKAKAESGVFVVERWILAALRNRSFFSLCELNEAIRELLTRLNNRPFKKLPECRRSLFEKLDAPALKALPATRYEYAEWKHARVNIDYHVEVQGHYYSVPYALVREQIEVRITASTVECFHKGARVASHLRCAKRGAHSTQREHMPLSHQRYLEWTPSRLIRWAEKIGPSTGKCVEEILGTRAHPEQGFRACLGILRLAKSYGEQRLEAACQRAQRLASYSYKTVASILKQGLGQRSLGSAPKLPPVEHPNIRGPQYYQDPPPETPEAGQKGEKEEQP